MCCVSGQRRLGLNTLNAPAPWGEWIAVRVAAPFFCSVHHWSFRLFIRSNSVGGRINRTGLRFFLGVSSLAYTRLLLLGCAVTVLNCLHYYFLHSFGSLNPSVQLFGSAGLMPGFSALPWVVMAAGSKDVFNKKKHTTHTTHTNTQTHKHTDTQTHTHTHTPKHRHTHPHTLI